MAVVKPDPGGPWSTGNGVGVPACNAFGVANVGRGVGVGVGDGVTVTVTVTGTGVGDGVGLNKFKKKASRKERVSMVKLCQDVL